MNATWRTISVTPTSSGVGAEIGGVDIASGISDEQFLDIREAYGEYGVIFLRDQDITPEQHIAFAKRWGPININRFFKAVEGYPQIAELRKEPEQTANIGGMWHTDHSYDQVPAMGSILCARELPSSGGDTLFASMYAAHDALSDGLRNTLSTMRAVHSSEHVFGKASYTANSAGDFAGRVGNPDAATQSATHPVIIRHPLSGRPALYVNGNFTVRFEGWSAEESQPLINYLAEHASRDDYTCRFKWRDGSMAIWHNRATQHRAMNDYHGERRLMHRITLDGEELHPATSA